MDSTVMKTLTGLTSCKLKNEKDLQSENPSTFTATITGAKEVFSLFPGIVPYLGYYQGSGTVVLSVSNNEIIRYMNLTDIEVSKGYQVVKGRALGKTIKDTLLFEYCTHWQGNSKYPVRVDDQTYFKQNPLDILNGLYTPVIQIDLKKGYNLLNDTLELTKDQENEFEIVPSNDMSVEISKDAITNLSEMPDVTKFMISDNKG